MHRDQDQPKHIQLIDYPEPELQKVWDCRDCASSCQSACKTSCTLANQVCERFTPEG